MEPTLMRGARILIDRGRTEPRGGDIFVLRSADGLVVKRAGEDEHGGRVMVSDHPDWEMVSFPDDAEIIGRVAWTARTLVGGGGGRMTGTGTREKGTGRLRSLIGSVWPWIMAALIVIVVMAVLGYVIWDWLRSGADEKETNGATLRNFSLALAGLAGLAGAFIGVPLAAWRGLTAHDQAKAAHDQAETSGAELRNGRYQAGAGMLGNTVFATRLGGIYALERLARDHPNEYHIQIMEILSAFVRHPIEDEALRASMPKAPPGSGPGRRLPDRDEAIRVIGRRSDEQIETENARSYRVNLSDAILGGANLRGVDLSGVDLYRADFSGANLIGANLGGANLGDAILYRANLGGADLGGANLDGVKNLIQDQLDTAVQHPDHGPPTGLPGGRTWDEDAAKERYLPPHIWRGVS